MKRSVLPRLTERTITIVGALICAAVLCVLFIGYADAPPYTVESWSFYEVSRTIFTDFYTVNTVRQYQFPPELGVSFPPLWPSLIAVFNAVADTEWYGPYALAFVAAALTIPVFVFFASRVFGRPYFGPFLYGLLLLDPAYRMEVLSGGANPLSVALIFLMLAVLAGGKNSARTAAVAGLFAGLAAMNRFDFLLAGACAGTIAITIGTGSVGDRVRRAAAFGTSFVAVLSPWIAYSIAHFSVPFVTDNSRTALASVVSFVTDFNLQPLPTIFDEPIVWLLRYKAGVLRLLHAFLEAASFTLAPLVMTAVFVAAYAALRTPGAKDGRLSVLRASSAIFLGICLLNATAGSDYDRSFAFFPAVLVVILAAAVSLIRGGRLSSLSPMDERTSASTRFLWTAAPIFLVQFLSIATTGYFDRRYVTLPVLFLCAVLLCHAATALGRLGVGRTAAVFSTLVLALSLFQFHSSVSSVNYLPPHAYRNEEILSCVGEDARLLVLEPDIVDPFEFGAITGVRTYMKPLNLNGETAVILAQRYGVTHVAMDHRTSTLFMPYFGLERVCDAPVYRLSSL